MQSSIFYAQTHGHPRTEISLMPMLMKYKSATEALAGIKDLKILGREMVFLAKYVVYAQNHARSNISAGVISQLPRYTLETIAFGGILLIVLINLGSQETIRTRWYPSWHFTPLQGIDCSRPCSRSLQEFQQCVSTCLLWRFYIGI